MSVSGFRSRAFYDEPHKSEQYPLCTICASWRAPPCVFVCVGGGCHCHEATRDTLANCQVHIPEPQSRNHLSLPLHFAWFNVAMC